MRIITSKPALVGDITEKRRVIHPNTKRPVRGLVIRNDGTAIIRYATATGTESAQLKASFLPSLILMSGEPAALVEDDREVPMEVQVFKDPGSIEGFYSRVIRVQPGMHRPVPGEFVRDNGSVKLRGGLEFVKAVPV